VIWKRWCLPDPTDRSWGCLTPEGQQAAYSSAGYLLLVARHAVGGFVGDLEQKLADYFETGSDPYSGFHRCDWVW
jgi:hypothetical protein